MNQLGLSCQPMAKCPTTAAQRRATTDRGLALLALRPLSAFGRLPTTYRARDYVEAAGFMSCAPSLPDMFRRAAGYVDKILKGTKPADLPIEQPPKFELVMNLNTARTLGLTLPPWLLLRADQVIE